MDKEKQTAYYQQYDFKFSWCVCICFGDMFAAFLGADLAAVVLQLGLTCHSCAFYLFIFFFTFSLACFIKFVPFHNHPNSLQTHKVLTWSELAEPFWYYFNISHLVFFFCFFYVRSCCVLIVVSLKHSIKASFTSTDCQQENNKEVGTKALLCLIALVWYPDSAVLIWNELFQFARWQQGWAFCTATRITNACWVQ